VYPIISVSGFPGSGKSTLCRKISERLDVCYLDYDDFGTLTHASSDVLNDWLEAGMPYKALFSDKFTKRVVEASRASPVIIETPLGPEHGEDGIKVSLSVWLEAELDIALLRALTKVIDDDWNSVQQLQSWLSNYYTAYQTFVRNSLLRQKRTIGARCDITVEANRPIEEVVSETYTSITSRLGLPEFVSDAKP
jgi:uridine kinase